jgi:hypothetical protein
MVTIVMVKRLGRIVRSLALVIAFATAFAMHTPIACQAAPRSCPHSSSSDAPAMPCCKTVMCAGLAIDAHHDAATVAPSFANSLAPTIIAYLAPRPSLSEIALAPARTPSPPRRTPLVIELQTILV